ncbi:MAG: hypothetical protein GXP63_03430 [DPANN group archaeon]|nr:hypothetical protein [DPANN group archaeon]
MVKDGIITTGVDKLLELIESKNRVSLGEAAKTLSVPKTVVEEWVNFLEEKELIQVQYKFTTPYLVRKQMTEKEILERANEFKGHREGFVRKVESALALLETETLSLRNAQNNFKKFSEGIEQELGKVKKELDTLDKYDHLKKDMDDEILRQQTVFEQKILDLKKQVKLKQDRYNLIEKKVKAEEDTLQDEKSRAESLMKKENGLAKKLDHLKQAIIELGGALSGENKVIKLEETHIDLLRTQAEALNQEMEERKSGIQRIIDESKRKETEILRMQKEIIDKIASETKKIHGKVSVSKEAKEHFRSFFDKKVRMDIMMDKVTGDLSRLEQELRELIVEAQAVDFTRKKTNAKEHAAKLEKKFKDIRKKKELFMHEAKKLNTLMKDMK